MNTVENYLTTENYLAMGGQPIAQPIAAAISPFTIEVRFLGGLTEGQKDAFKSAANRWSQIIIGDLPSVLVDGEVIDDVLIFAQGGAIDGLGGILGQAGPTHLRPANAGVTAFIPAKGRMTFDTADLNQMEQNGTLNDVITHEMGHVLGIGTIWSNKSLIQGARTRNPIFVGQRAMEEYGRLRGGDSGSAPVPVENTGSVGTRDSHWRESIFLNELMSGFIAAANNPICGVTVASLQDFGYQVNMDAAEPYQLPDLRMLAEGGLLTAREAPIDIGTVLPHIPLVLPEDSLQ
jgi:hypothetical protein